MNTTDTGTDGIPQFLIRSAATTIGPATGSEAGTNRLPVLAAEIRTAMADASAAAIRSFQRAIEAGERLIEAKALVPHGGWLPWLREHCGIGERTAQRYMRLAEHKEALLKSDTVSDLTSMRDVFRLLGAFRLDNRTGHQSPSLARPAEEAAPVSPAPTTFTAKGIEVDSAEPTPPEGPTPKPRPAPPAKPATAIKSVPAKQDATPDRYRSPKDGCWRTASSVEARYILVDVEDMEDTSEDLLDWSSLVLTAAERQRVLDCIRETEKNIGTFKQGLTEIGAAS